MIILIDFTKFPRMAALQLTDDWHILDAFALPVCIPTNNAYSGSRTQEQWLNAFLDWCADAILTFADQKSHDRFIHTCKILLGKSPANKTVVLSNILPATAQITESIPTYWGQSSLLPVLQMREMLQHAELPAETLVSRSKAAFSKPKSVSDTAEQLRSAKYIYEAETGLVHRKGCELLPANGVYHAFSSLDKPAGRGYRACACCKAEYREAVRKRAERIIQNTKYRYLFTPEGTVFHTPSCQTLRNARAIHGINDFQTAIARGRRPCRLCLPEEAAEFTEAKEPAKGWPKRKLTVYEENAISVHSDIHALLKHKDNWEPYVQKHAQVLTDPSVAFLAEDPAGGYFHLRSCKQVKKCDTLIGMGLYGEAIQAGLKPCPHCNPSASHNIPAYIPLYSTERPKEGLEILSKLCKEAGYTHDVSAGIYEISTPAGRWFLHIETLPYKLEHINFTYAEAARHWQPVLLLSFRDAFIYIDRHDQKLLKNAP